MDIRAAVFLSDIGLESIIYIQAPLPEQQSNSPNGSNRQIRTVGRNLFIVLFQSPFVHKA